MPDLNLTKKPDSPQELFFFYKPQTKEVLYSSIAIEEFFETSIDLHHKFPFTNYKQSDAQNLADEWQHCLQLKEKETSHFNFQTTTPDGIPLLFRFEAVGINPSDYSNSPVVLFSIKKDSANKRTMPHGKNSLIHQKDYAEFIDLASHDLDAPLRKLAVLIERLALKHQTEPGSDMDVYFDRIQTSLAEMRSLLDSLARLSGLNTTGAYVRCDLNTIVGEVLNNLCKHPEYNKIVAAFQTLPVLNGDKEQYRQLFENLLQNAARFCKKEEPLQVEIVSTALPDPEKIRLGLPLDKPFFCITVKDNGIGFEEKYAEKIFRPFVRLHGKSEYPGNGMGLALCKKITENHGGIIYAESNENNGATFILILPQSP